MKLYIAIMTLLMSLNAAAAGDPNLAMSQNGTEAQGQCDGQCYEADQTRNQVFQMRDLRGRINQSVVPATILKIAKATKYTNGPFAVEACSGFVNEKGFGEWGKYLTQELTPENYPYIFKGTPDLLDDRICPNWDNLSTESKQGIIILALASASQMESTCNPKAINRNATNGTAYGLTQLHLDREDEGIGRCEVGSAREPKKSLKCMARNLDAQISQERAFLTRQSHFAVFFPNSKGKAIFNAIRKYPGCH